VGVDTIAAAYRRTYVTRADWFGSKISGRRSLFCINQMNRMNFHGLVSKWQHIINTVVAVIGTQVLLENAGKTTRKY